MTDIREETPMGRFEIICERYINGTETERALILSLIPDGDIQTFLQGCGLYHLFTDPVFYKSVETSMAKTLYDELRGTSPAPDPADVVQRMIDDVSDKTLSRYRGSVTRKAYEDDIRRIKTFVDLSFYLKDNYEPEDKENGNL